MNNRESARTRVKRGRRRRFGSGLRQRVLPTTRRINKTYEAYSPVYDLVFGKVFDTGRKLSVDLLDPKPGQRILDAGVGTGLNLPLFPRGCEVVGIDLCRPMLDRSVARAHRLGLNNIRFARMDMQRLAFPDNSFDGVISLYTISVVPDPVATIREFQRVCKPGGHIVFTNHFKSDHPVVGRIEELIASGATFLGFETDVQLGELLAKLDLTPVRIEKTNMLKMWRAVLCVNN